MTTVRISGPLFTIDGKPTYAGRSFEGQAVEGLLFNVRAVQATFDDANQNTRPLWAYPDTGVWDPERNTEDFCRALPSWRRHGVLAFTMNFQGGGPRYDPAVYNAFDNNAFTPAGRLKRAYARRMGQVLEQADKLSMVPIVGLFYWKHLYRMDGERAIRRAAEEACQFLLDSGHRNLLIEIANENQETWPWECLRPTLVHRFIQDLRATFSSQKLLLATSIIAKQMVPPSSLISASDFILIHGNGMRPEEMSPYIARIRATWAYRQQPKPIIWNEDSPNVGNLDAAFAAHTSWGYYDQGYGSQWTGDLWVDYPARERETSYAELSGFQTPPINWTINTDLKRRFFRQVAQITGHPGARPGPS